MAEPLDAVMAFHNAFRRDIANIDAAALDLARGKTGFIKHLSASGFLMKSWFGRSWRGACFLSHGWKLSHRWSPKHTRKITGSGLCIRALNAAVSHHDPLVIARAASAFKFHLDIHLEKEDTHLYRIVKERVPMPDQSKAIGIMAGNTPQNRFPEVVAWLYPLLDHNDRENMTRIWQMLMPPPHSTRQNSLSKGNRNDWAELTLASLHLPNASPDRLNQLKSGG